MPIRPLFPLVYGGGRIEVVFNYKDVFDTMCECVE